MKLRFTVSSAYQSYRDQYRDRLEGLTVISTKVEMLKKTNGSTVFTLTVKPEHVQAELEMLAYEFDIEKVEVSL